MTESDKYEHLNSDSNIGKSASPEVKQISNPVNKPKTRAKKDKDAGQVSEQPKCNTCRDSKKLPWTHPAVKEQVLDASNGGGINDEYSCPDCIGQPNTNAMIFEQINGCQNMTIELLNQLKPRTESVECCIVTLKSWQDNNLKYLQKAFE